MMRNSVTICFIIAFLLCLGAQTIAQDSLSRTHKKTSSSKVKKAAEDVSKSLRTNDDEKTAVQYEILANELTDKGDLAKAEEYLIKAKDIYTRLNKEDNLATVIRNLAKVQELQEKYKSAIKNYESAAGKSKDSFLERVNSNDANRLRTVNPKTQEGYAQDNALIFEKEGKKDEAANAYKQVAASQVLQKNSAGALSNIKKAIDISPNPKEVVTLSNKMAELYASNNQLDSAIALSEKVLSNARNEHDTEQQIIQLQQLSNLYEQYHKIDLAELRLKEALDLSVKSGSTIKSKESALLLARFYEKQKQNDQSLLVYKNYLSNLDVIIKKDSSLIDVKLFEVTEDRIKDLEKEKTLQNELMRKKTRFNYFLTASVVVMLLLLFFIVRALNAIRIKNKKIALQSLRREMNPHFIFNSLNSVNQYIAESNELEANKFLTAYSSLMRNVMENSSKDLVPLNVEIEQLKKYLELEHQRFITKFDYSITVADNIDTELTLIPNMLIQPHLENAVWHGLRYKANKGQLKLNFSKKAQQITVSIIDDGIGITKSQLLKTANQKQYQSRGVKNTIERIKLLNEIYKTNIIINIQEIKNDGNTGTRVEISIPIMTKK